MANVRAAAPRTRTPSNTAKRSSGPTRILVARGDDVQAIHIRPRTIVTVGAAFAVFSLLYIGATAYLLLRDDLIQSSGDQQERLLEGYEDRITALRTEIDRVTSRRALDHATVSEKVDRLLDMQQTLDERQRLIGRLADAARRAGFDIAPPPPPPKPADGPQASAAPVAAPIVQFASASGDGATPAPAALDQVEREIDTMQSEQQQFVGGLATRVATRADRLTRLLTQLGQKPPKVKAEDIGGPFVAADGTETGLGAFGAEVDTLEEQLDRLATIRRVAQRLPLAEPIPDAIITSGFGTRVDPFLGRLAMHTGVDFRAERGSPARATAAGTVIAAEWNGGYGNMVDVDHGNGVVTRYGHLSAITVKVGDHVDAGGQVGRVGSTGRSTGPHLHYEIRIGGDPIDPTRYLKAGEEIAALL